MVTRNCKMRFLNNNFAETVTPLASSALSSFPIANTQDLARFKVWSPTGNFDIVSGDNLIYINDGSNKTATITAGSYATPVLMAAQIQTQLNAVSSNWTCTWSSTTMKFTIVRTSGTAVLRHSVASDMWDILGYTKTTDTTASTFLAQEQRIHTSEHVTYDFGFQANIQAFAAIGPIDEIFTISNNATVRLLGNNLNNLWASPEFELAIDVTDLGCFAFLDAIEDTRYRYWRLDINDRLNPNGVSAIRIGHIYLGDYVTFDQTNLSLGFNRQIFDRSDVIEAESGAKFYNQRSKIYQFGNMNVQLATDEERLAIEQLFFDLGQSESFYVCLDPTQAISTNLTDTFKYVRLSGIPSFQHVFRDRFNISMEMEEVI